MKIYADSKTLEKIEIKKWFTTRTENHISLVQKYCKKIFEYDPSKFSEIIERGKVHDDSKFKNPEMDPYIYIAWQYKCKEDGKEFNVPKEMKDKMSKATEHHVKNNRHHPEFHSDKEVNLINREDRDKPPKEIIDATKMDDLDIAEMVADWCAMSDEKESSPKKWADKNVNIRWKFSDSQKDLIYELIGEIFDENK